VLNAATLLVLEQSLIFGSLPRAMLQQIGGMAQIKELAAGEFLFREGEPGSALFGVISGEIRIQTSSKDGRDFNLNTIGAGEIIGEIAFLDGGTRTASGRALVSSTLFSVPRPPLMVLLQKQPQIAIRLLELVCQRVRWTSDQVAEFAFVPPAARLARRVLHLARSARTSADGSTLEVRISQAELARFLGVSRQIVNGYLQNWRQLGAISLARGCIRIADEPLLEELMLTQATATD